MMVGSKKLHPPCEGTRGRGHFEMKIKLLKRRKEKGEGVFYETRAGKGAITSRKTSVSLQTLEL